MPNLSGFLLNATTCRNGGPRPCAIAIRTEPELSAPYVNGFPDQHISWPLEAYAGEPGDPVKVECVRTDGQPVSDYLGDPPSPDWYEVQVPAEYAHNPQVRLGYAAIVWFGEQEPAADVPVCVGN